MYAEEMLLLALLLKLWKNSTSGGKVGSLSADVRDRPKHVETFSTLLMDKGFPVQTGGRRLFSLLSFQ